MVSAYLEHSGGEYEDAEVLGLFDELFENHSTSQYATAGIEFLKLRPDGIVKLIESASDHFDYQYYLVELLNLMHHESGAVLSQNRWHVLDQMNPDQRIAYYMDVEPIWMTPERFSEESELLKDLGHDDAEIEHLTNRLETAWEEDVTYRLMRAARAHSHKAWTK